MDRDPQNTAFMQQFEVIRKGVQTFMRTLEPLAERMQTFAKNLKAIEEALAPTAEALVPIVLKAVREFSQLEQYREVLGRAGWVPHYTTPFGYVTECDDDIEAIRSGLCDHYKNNWLKVRLEIESRLSSYNITSEAKATFREALDAHEAGLYRCVCRVLFPEIDQLFRTELFENKIGNMGSKAMIKGLVAGESDLAQDKSLGDFMPNGIYELILFEYLTKVLKEKDEIDITEPIFGLYTSFNTEETLERLKQDPVPNRNAAMHGLVAYSTPQNSLNMIFVADYIFQIISSFKESPGNVIYEE